MAKNYDTMMEPQVEGLLDRAGSKFGLCTLASTRARQINAYFGDLKGEGIGAHIPPQITSVARKPLSIAFEEISSDKIVKSGRTRDSSGCLRRRGVSARLRRLLLSQASRVRPFQL